MESGTDIDINELRPKEMVVKEREAFTKQKREKTLREQAEYLNIILSPQGKKLIDLIVKKMEKRINYLINEDPEAKAYKKILDELKYKENLAKKAIGDLYDMKLEN